MIKSLTSLRFVFAFMVFMSHNVIDSTVPFIQHFFKEGYVGVEFFFVLSGFILAYNYQKLLVEKKISLKCFYKARFARIYPLHLLTLVVAAVTAKNVVLNFEYLAYLVANLTLLQSFIPLPDFYFAFNAPSWSISDEFAFYMAFPFIVCFATKKVNAFRIILLIAAASILTLTLFVTRDAHQHALFYINPVFRIFDFCLGITLFQFCSRLEESYPRLLNNVIGGGVIEALAVLLFIGFYCTAYYLPQVYRFAMWYWIPVSGIIGTFYLSRNGWISKMLGNKIFVKLGEISFGFYLFHQLFGGKLNGFLAKINVELDYPCYFLTLFGITLVASYLSYMWFEKPVNQWIKKL